MLEMVIVAKTRAVKQSLIAGLHLGSDNVPWMVSYLYNLVDLLKIDNSRTFYSKNVLLHIIWECTNIIMTLSQVSLITFKHLMSGIGAFSMFDYLGQGTGLPHPHCFDSAVVFLFGCYLAVARQEQTPAEPAKREQQKYDDTNIFDLKLQEFFIVSFTTSKVELHEYFQNVQDNKFPKLLTVFSKLSQGSGGPLAFYSKNFAVNHDANFRVSLAFILAEHGEHIRCESVIKQILEQENTDSPLKQ